MLQKEKVDVVFTPAPEEMYPTGFGSSVLIDNIETLSQEGKSRPGHFSGVATVLAKLFNIVQPQKAFFGQKDGIQTVVIKKLVRDLNFPIEVVIGDTLREADGLAMSSRNVFLSSAERKIAPTIHLALLKVKTMFQLAVRNIKDVLDAAKRVIEAQPQLQLDYINIVDLESGADLHDEIPLTGAMVSIAVFLGRTRLIDNIVLK